MENTFVDAASCHALPFVNMGIPHDTRLLKPPSCPIYSVHPTVQYYCATKALYDGDNITEKGLILQYQLHNRVENLADVSTRCSGLLLRPEEDQSIWSKRRQGFQPCCEAGIGEPTLSDA